MAPPIPLTTMQGRTNSGTSALILLALVIFRLVNTYFVQTFFQPDEFFQALEPGWKLAFGHDSGAWITWEWREGLRTSVHPHLFAAAYKSIDWLCGMLQLDYQIRASALIAAPRILQAVAAALMDYFTWRLATKIYAPEHAASYTTLALTVLSPWQWHCSTRTFSNSLEATLTAVSLFYFPWAWFLSESDLKKEKDTTPIKLSSNGLHLALVAAAAAFYLRPTNIIIWIAISAALVWSNRSSSKAIALLSAAALSGTAVLIAFASADRMFYGTWVLPPLRFLYMNVVQSLAVFYGTNRVDYYFTEGLPLLLTTALPFTLVGVWQSLQDNKGLGSQQDGTAQRSKFVFATIILFTVLALSSIAHKEMRFIYPLLPMLHVLAASPAVAFFTPPSKRKARATVLTLLVAVNILIAYYVSMIHQRGVMDVMHYLRHQQESRFEASPAAPTNISVGFLMPCHSTPWRSHFVYPEIKAWALTCEPPINLSSPQARESYLDEADIFYNDPLAWLDANMQNRKGIMNHIDPNIRQTIQATRSTARPWPRYLVFFEHLEPIVVQVLQGSKYKLCRRFFNTHWHDDHRRKGDVVVWCMRP